MSGAADEVDRLLADDLDLQAALAEPLDDLLEVAGADDELVIDFGAVLDWFNRWRTVRVSPAGLLLGLSAGLTWWVAGAVSGVVSPSQVLDSVRTGAGMYLVITAFEARRDADLQLGVNPGPTPAVAPVGIRGRGE